MSQQEKLVLLNELKEARELLQAMQHPKGQQDLSQEQSVEQSQPKIQLLKRLSGVNEEETFQ